MNTRRFKESVQAGPHPVTVVMTDGSRHEIPHTDFVLFYPDGDWAALVDRSGHMHILDIASVTELILSKPRKRKAA